MRFQAPMAQGRSTKIISMTKWIRTSRLTIKNSLSSRYLGVRLEEERAGGVGGVRPAGKVEASRQRHVQHLVLQPCE